MRDYSIFKEFKFERQPVAVSFMLKKPEGIEQMEGSLGVCEMFAKAQEYVEANMPAAIHGVVLESSDVVRGHWDPESETWTPGAMPFNAVEVTTRQSETNGNALNLFLAPILGVGSLDMEASAVAYVRAASAWDCRCSSSSSTTWWRRPCSWWARRGWRTRR